MQDNDLTFASLRGNEAFLNTLLDSAPQGIVIVNKNGHIVLANKTAETLFAYSSDEIVGQPVRMLVPEMIRPSHNSYCSDYFEEPSTRAMGAGRDLHAQKSDGSEFPVEIGLNAFITNGESYVLVAVVDISERKKIEEELRLSDERWRFALEGNHDGVWDWNIESKEVFFSKQWKAMLGFEEHELENSLEEWEKRVHPDDKDDCYADINRHFEGETSVYINEHRVLAKDGTYMWILDRGKLMSRSKNGAPERMVGTHTDITERKNMEQALRDSEERYRQLADNSPVPILVHSENKIVYANAAAAKVLEASVIEDLVGNAPFDIVHPDFRANAAERTKALRADKTPTPLIEEKFLTANGRTIDVEVMATAIEYYGKAASQLVFQDITERKKARKLLEKAASTDLLTGLSNRREFAEKFDIEVSRFKRSGEAFSIILCDIDHFKIFNDTYGHDCGDFVLETVADIFRESLRKQDIIGRWGGEEFVMLLPDTGIDGAAVSAEKIRSTLEARILTYGSANFSVTMSFGVSLYDSTMSMEDCVKLADNRLYHAKEHGRNRVVAED